MDHKRELAEWCWQHQLPPPLYDREAVGPSTHGEGFEQGGGAAAGCKEGVMQTASASTREEDEHHDFQTSHQEDISGGASLLPCQDCSGPELPGFLQRVHGRGERTVWLSRQHQHGASGGCVLWGWSGPGGGQRGGGKERPQLPQGHHHQLGHPRHLCRTEPLRRSPTSLFQTVPLLSTQCDARYISSFIIFM